VIRWRLHGICRWREKSLDRYRDRCDDNERSCRCRALPKCAQLSVVHRLQPAEFAISDRSKL